MGLRKQKRAIARARMAIVGFEHINTVFSMENADGVKEWRAVLMDKQAERAQLARGIKAKRKIRKIERTA